MSEKCNKFRLNFIIEEDNNTEKINLLSFLESKGKTAFLYDNFKISALETEIKTFLHTEKKLKTETETGEDGITKITFFPENSIKEKLKLSEKYTLLLFQKKNILKFVTLTDDFFKNGKEKSMFNIISFVNNSYDKEISELIYNYVSIKYLKNYPERKPSLENHFIEKLSLNEHILISEILGNEKLLLKLNFRSAKNKISAAEIKNINSGFIFAGNKSIYLVMLNENDAIKECVEITKSISVKKNILKTRVEADNFIIYPKRSASKLFIHFPDIQYKENNERIRKIAELNSEIKNYAGAEYLYQFLIEKENNPLDIFLMFLNKYKNSNTDFEAFLLVNDISKIVNDVLLLDNYDEILNKIFFDKNLSFDEKIVIINLFSDVVPDSEELKKILPIYSALRKIFLKKNKERINRTVFDIKFAEFLLRCHKNRKSKKILQDLLKHLPDETISDLLPPDNLDLTSDKSGQLLKATIFDLLAKAKDKEDATEEIQKTILLQPLNLKRLDKLSAVKQDVLRKQADTAKNILTGNGLFADDNPVCRTDYKMPDENVLRKHLQHPSVLKKGSFYNIGKWISEIKTDDYSSVRKYSEKISPETYNTLFAVLKNTANVFGFKDIEFYITKGDRNDEIIGYEGSPPFVILGDKYLNKNSELYMNLSELLFTATSEIAHIFFKHTKLTSKDIWRGLIEKGIFVADAALAVIPVAGFLAKTLKNVPKLNLLTKIFQGTANSIIGGKSAYDAALRLTEYYGKKGKTKKENQKSLLAASRLMQYTADRAGLLVCGNLASAVRAVLLTEKFDNNPLDEIKNTSLKEFLLKQNSDGTFKYQKTALRIANLYSFWFSEDYELLRKNMEKRG